MRKLAVLAVLASFLAAPVLAADGKKTAKAHASAKSQQERTPPEAAPPPVRGLPRATQENRQFIKSVQDMLVQAGHMSAGEADGRLGARTKDALKQFQKANGFKDDGRLTPETFERLAQKTRE